MKKAIFTALFAGFLAYGQLSACPGIDTVLKKVEAVLQLEGQNVLFEDLFRGFCEGTVEVEQICSQNGEATFWVSSGGHTVLVVVDDNL